MNFSFLSNAVKIEYSYTLLQFSFFILIYRNAFSSIQIIAILGRMQTQNDGLVLQWIRPEEVLEELRFLQNSREGQPTGKCTQNGKRFWIGFFLFVGEDLIYSVISATSRVYTHEVSDKMEKLMNHSDMNKVFCSNKYWSKIFSGKRKKKRNTLDSRTGWREWKKEAARLKTVVQIRKFEITRWKICYSYNFINSSKPLFEFYWIFSGRIRTSSQSAWIGKWRSCEEKNICCTL